MQAIRQSITIAIQRRVTFVRPSLITQQARSAGSDSRSSENQKKNDKQSDPNKGSSLNKTKTSDKKQNLKTTDDTKQPGATRKDWSKPNQIIGNDPSYGKASRPTDVRDPDRGKNHKFRLWLYITHFHVVTQSDPFPKSFAPLVLPSIILGIFLPLE